VHDAPQESEAYVQDECAAAAYVSVKAREACAVQCAAAAEARRVCEAREKRGTRGAAVCARAARADAALCRGASRVAHDSTAFVYVYAL